MTKEKIKQILNKPLKLWVVMGIAFFIFFFLCGGKECPECVECPVCNPQVVQKITDCPEIERRLAEKGILFNKCKSDVKLYKQIGQLDNEAHIIASHVFGNLFTMSDSQLYKASDMVEEIAAKKVLLLDKLSK